MKIEKLIYVLDSFLASWSNIECNNECDTCPFGHIIFESDDDEPMKLCTVLNSINDEMEEIMEKLEVW